MLEVTDSFKSKMKAYGKQLNLLLEFGITTLDKDYVKKLELSYNGDILTSIMRCITLEVEQCNIIEANEINIKLGVKVLEDEKYEYVDWGNFDINRAEIEEKIETNSVKLVLYDHLIDTHIKYSDSPLQLDFSSGEITVKDFLQAICDKFGFTLKTLEFANSTKIISEDKYLELDVTYRDILDEIAATTGGFIKIFNTDLFVAYPQETGEVIDENDLEKLMIGQLNGYFNSVVLSRTPQEDNIYYPNDMLPDERISIRIENNQIMDRNREDFIEKIYNKINGLSYYTYEYMSYGFGYFEFGDIVTLKDLKGEEFKTIQMNIITTITTGIKEKSYAEGSAFSETKYEYASGIEKRQRNTEIIVNKQEYYIDSLVTDMYEEDGVVQENFTKVHQDINNIINSVQNSGGNNLIINSVMFAYDNNNLPTDWTVEGEGTLSINSSAEALNSGSASGHIFTLKNKIVRQRIYVKADSSDTPADQKAYYTFSTKIKKEVTGSCYIKIFNENEEYIVQLNEEDSSFYGDYEIKALLPKSSYYDIEFGSINCEATFTDNMFNIGEYKNQWQQANGEIMNTQVNINVNGVLVKSSVYQGDYTIMSPLEFSGYSKLNSIITKVFTLNKDVTSVQKLESKDEIKMKPIKVVPINTRRLTRLGFCPIKLRKR